MNPAVYLLQNSKPRQETLKPEEGEAFQSSVMPKFIVFLGKKNRLRGLKDRFGCFLVFGVLGFFWWVGRGLFGVRG